MLLARVRSDFPRNRFSNIVIQTVCREREHLTAQIYAPSYLQALTVVCRFLVILVIFAF